jgi:hypothetical protein
VTAIDRIEHTQTRLVSGASKLILSLPRFCAACHGGVRDVAHDRGADHEHAHDEDPGQEQRLVLGRDRERDERDQRHAGDAVGLEAVGGRPHRVAGVVARAVGDHARVPRVVLLDLEHHLHQVGADVGDLGEDAAGDAQRRGAERLADREAEEARARLLGRHPEQDREHHQQLDADQQHADAHARLERDLVDRERLALERGERRAAVRERVHADAEPRHAVRAEDAQHREREDGEHADGVQVLQEAEVVDDAGADEELEHHEQLALLQEVGLARLVDGVAHVEHRLVRRHPLDLVEHHQAEQHAEHAHAEADHEQLALARLERGQLEVQLARERGGGKQAQGQGGEQGRRGDSPQGGACGA